MTHWDIQAGVAVIAPPDQRTAGRIGRSGYKSGDGGAADRGCGGKACIEGERCRQRINHIDVICCGCAAVENGDDIFEQVAAFGRVGGLFAR